MGVEGGAPRQVAQDKLSEIHDQAFSPIGRWLSFSMSATDRRRDLYMYNVASGVLTRLGDAPGHPPKALLAFSQDGKFSGFSSSRHENPVGSDVDFDFAILKSAGIYAIPLAADSASPVAPRSDEGDTFVPTRRTATPRTTSSSRRTRTARTPRPGPPRTTRPRRTASGAIAPIRVDLDGMMARAVALPIDPSNLAQMDARDDRIFYLTQPLGLIDGNLKGEKSALHMYDLKKRKDVTIAEDVDAYSLSLDGQRVLIRHDKDYTVLDTKADAAKDDDTANKLDLSHMRMLVDAPVEWTEMFENAWRLERDMFFSTAMNGQNWRAIHDNYAKLLPTMASR